MRTVGAWRLILCLITLVSARAVAQPCDFTWNTTSGNWFTATNWTPNGVPGSASNVCFSSNGNTSPNVNTSATVNSIQFSGNGTVSITGDPLQSLRINGGIIASGNGAFTITMDGLVLGANQTWNLSQSTAPVITAPLQGPTSTEVLTKTGSSGLRLSLPSFPLGGIIWAGVTP